MRGHMIGDDRKSFIPGPQIVSTTSCLLLSFCLRRLRWSPPNLRRRQRRRVGSVQHSLSRGGELLFGVLQLALSIEPSQNWICSPLVHLGLLLQSTLQIGFEGAAIQEFQPKDNAIAVCIKCKDKIKK